jgi:hydrogenase maturation protease
VRSEKGAATEPVLIVGAGRVRHGDDAVGILVARLAKRRLAGHAALLLDLGGWATLDSLEGRRMLIVVDAAMAQDGFRAGEWRRIDFLATPEALEECGVRDTHTAGVASMLEIARTLGKLPEEVWIYAIAGERFAPEERMSAAVRGVAMKVAAQIDADVRDWAGRA